MNLKNLSFGKIGLIVSSLLLFGAIWLASINTHQALLGWDNFSISLDLKTNFFRTLFSSWRAYRGLGVPGDSESVDIFRFLVQTVLSFVLPLKLVDQVYYLILYTTGMVSTYWLVKYLTTLQIKNKNYSGYLPTLAGIVGGITYGFNFYAFETFFMPVAMYPARYAFLPLLLLAFIRLINGKKPNLNKILFFIVVSLFATTAYLTATVFITIILLLSTIFLGNFGKWRSYFVVSISFVLLNSFWLFPFANYTFQKAHLLPQASSFTSVNESLLNKPARIFSWENILTLYPQTISKEALPFTDLKTGEAAAIHPILDQVDSSILIFTPLILSILGALTIMIMATRHKNLTQLWPLSTVLLMLFLLRKELPPLGFLYEFLLNNIPFFEIVFRFGGAKFYPLLLVGLSVLAGFGLLLILKVFNFLPRKLATLVQVGVALVFVGIIAFPFRNFFTQGIFSTVVRTEVPVGYQQLAAKINQDLPSGRVLHLPTDEFSYWKSHDWGYFGSSFLSFMLKVPLLDRTFEPASLENDYYFQQLQQEIIGISLVSNSELNQRIKRLERLFANTGTQFIVFDPSISTDIAEERLKAWGVFHSSDYKFAVNQLAKAEVISLVDKFDLPESTETLNLYKVSAKHNQAQFLTNATNIDPNLEDGFSQPLLEYPNTIIQTPARDYLGFPFWQPRREIAVTDRNAVISLPQTFEQSQLSFNFPQTNSQQLYHDIYAQVDSDQLIVYLQPRLLPLPFSFDEKTADQLVFADLENPGELALSIADQVLAVPSDKSSSPHFLGSVLLDKQETIKVLSTQGTEQVNFDQIRLTRDPNCFQDKTEGYAYRFEEVDHLVSLITQNGMTCLTAPLVSSLRLEDQEEAEYYFKTNWKVNFESRSINENPFEFSTEPKLAQVSRQTVQELSDYLAAEICIFDIETGECLNTRDQFNKSLNSEELTIWTSQPATLPQVQASIVLPARRSQQSWLELEQASFQTFIPIAQTEYQGNATVPQTVEVALDQTKHLKLAVPYSPVTSVFTSQMQALELLTNPCVKKILPGASDTGIDQQGRILAYSENCPVSLYTQLPVESGLSYLWLGKYKLFSGRHPRMTVSQGNQKIYNQYLSRYNTYPDTPGYKQLQTAARPWWGDKSYELFVKEELIEDDYQWEGTLVNPDPNGSETLSFDANHFGEGPGLLGIEETAILEIPEYWHDLSFSTGEASFQFAPAEVVEVKSILPSLWQIEVNLDAENQPDTEYLLELDQAYDKQWQLYQTNNPILAFLGFGKVSATQVKVKGWSNGWIIPADELKTGNTKLYAFYTPERLAWFGWITTGVTIVSLLIICTRKEWLKKPVPKTHPVKKRFSKLKDSLLGNQS